MPGKTAINWTELSWGLFTGCSRIAPECINCYAELLTGTRLANNPKYKNLAVIRGDGRPHFTGEIRFHEDLLTWPIKKQKPALVFTNSMSDPFHENALTQWQDKFFAAMLIGNQHIYQVLTKRPDIMADYITNPKTAQRVYKQVVTLWNSELSVTRGGKTLPYPSERLIWPAPHIWLGTSVGCQKTAEKFTPDILRIPNGWLLWWSSEPLIGRVDPLPEWFTGDTETGNRIQWIVAGGESGDKDRARPMKTEWAEHLRKIAGDYSIPYWFKQPGVWHEIEFPERGYIIADTETRLSFCLDNAHCALSESGEVLRGDAMAKELSTKVLPLFRYGRKEADSPYRQFPRFPESFARGRELTDAQADKFCHYSEEQQTRPAPPSKQLPLSF